MRLWFCRGGGKGACCALPRQWCGNMYGAVLAEGERRLRMHVCAARGAQCRWCGPLCQPLLLATGTSKRCQDWDRAPADALGADSQQVYAELQVASSVPQARLAALTCLTSTMQLLEALARAAAPCLLTRLSWRVARRHCSTPEVCWRAGAKARGASTGGRCWQGTHAAALGRRRRRRRCAAARALYAPGMPQNHVPAELLHFAQPWVKRNMQRRHALLS